MTHEEAVKKWVENEMAGIPQEWFKIICDALVGEYQPLPMWGTMFLVNEFDGEKMMKNSRYMVYDKEDIDLDEIEEKEGKERRKIVEKAIEEDDYSEFEEYYDEEMSGAHCVLDKDGSTTAAYIYDVDGIYVLGINGAGWDFYDGVWDRLYDVCGLHWHKEEKDE